MDREPVLTEQMFLSISGSKLVEYVLLQHEDFKALQEAAALHFSRTTLYFYHVHILLVLWIIVLLLYLHLVLESFTWYFYILKLWIRNIRSSLTLSGLLLSNARTTTRQMSLRQFGS